MHPEIREYTHTKQEKLTRDLNSKDKTEIQISATKFVLRASPLSYSL